MHEAELLLEIFGYGVVGPPAGGQSGNSVHLLREPGPYDAARAAVLVVARARLEVADEGGAVEPEELIAVGDAPLVPR